jgi:hypothetical protein
LKAGIMMEMAGAVMRSLSWLDDGMTI